MRPYKSNPLITDAAEAAREKGKIMRTKAPITVITFLFNSAATKDNTLKSNDSVGFLGIAFPTKALKPVVDPLNFETLEHLKCRGVRSAKL